MFCHKKIPYSNRTVSVHASTLAAGLPSVTVAFILFLCLPFGIEGVHLALSLKHICASHSNSSQAVPSLVGE